MFAASHSYSCVRFAILLTATSACLLAEIGVCQDKGAPPWGEFLRQGRWPGVDRLLRRPFRESPEEEVKGLAAKLRARELDIPNRQKAVRYLKTFHCAQFPEARAMLVDVMLNDRWEPVRYEAAVGLRDMFANCACDAEEMSRREEKRALHRGAPDADAARHCSCCCDAETLSKLAKVAYELKEDGCCFEPSRRVREMAVEAIKVCGIPCHCQPYTAGEEYGPPALDVIDENKGNGGEFVPKPGTELNPEPVSQEAPIILPTVTEAKPIKGLNNICVVSLKEGRRLVASPEFASSYRGRIYHFATRAAQQDFEADPEAFAIAFGGCDPVHFVQQREVVEGRYLVNHEGRFYMFATRQNYETFRTDTVTYGGRQTTPAESSRTKTVALAVPAE